MMKERGFTLLETIVALVIASTALVIIIQSFSGGFRAKASIERQLTAARLGQSLLSKLENRFTIEDAPTAGVFENGMIWRAIYQPYVPSETEEPMAWWARIEVYPVGEGEDDAPLFSLTTLVQGSDAR